MRAILNIKAASGPDCVKHAMVASCVLSVQSCEGTITVRSEFLASFFSRLGCGGGEASASVSASDGSGGDGAEGGAWRAMGAHVSRDAVAVLESYCRSVDACVSRALTDCHGVGGEASSLFARLDAMERRAQAAHDDLRAMHTAVLTSVEGAGARMQGDAMGVMRTVEATVRGALDGLSSGSVAAAVSDAVRGWMCAEVQTLGAGALGAEVRTREAMQALVLEPLRQRQEELMTVVRALPTDVARDVSGDNARLLADLRTRLDDGMASHHRDVLEVCRCIDAAVRQPPSPQAAGAVGGLSAEVLRETVSQLEAGVRGTSAAVAAVQQQLQRVERDVSEQGGALCVLRKGGDDVASKLDALSQQVLVAHTRQASDLRTKGRTGESTLYELLCHKLRDRENYSVELVCGVAHQCDMVVRCLGRPDVRIESKAHGEHTGEKVRVREVKRFQSDLSGVNAHGIMVSLHSGIVGKGAVEVEPLSNGKFAVYLSHNNYDVDQIQDMIMLIYHLDEMTRQGDGCPGDNGVVRVPTEVLKRVELHLQEFSERVRSARGHLKETLTLLGDIAFESIAKLLLGGGAPTAAPSAPDADAGRDVPTSVPTRVPGRRRKGATPAVQAVS